LVFANPNADGNLVHSVPWVRLETAKKNDTSPMSPAIHLLASWIIAAKTTNTPRDCRLVTLAGILPDLDGLGLVVDVANSAIRHTETFLYGEYHHWYFHGAFGALLTSSVFACFGRQRTRVLLLCLIVFHLHLLCDLIGSRGPSAADLWPIYYLGPFSRHGMWVWDGQWPLDGWQNRVLGVALFFWALWLASGRDDSVVGIINRRADRVFVGVLRNWRDRWIKHS
jgi:inner membrane protein